MLFDSETFTKEMLSNPTKMSSVVIDAMQASDTGRTFVINDPNNGFVLQLLANTSIFGRFSEKVDYVNASFYAKRATNAEQLYDHLSEFDYVQLMASPATLPFLFAMSRNWIINNSVYYDENYDRIVIPETSYITMGGVTYSMYSPIEILVNRNTGGVVTAFYDGSFKNPLQPLATNILPSVRSYTKDGIEFFEIQFNMFQFTRHIEKFTASAEEGFNRRLSYSDQFYAIKVFTLRNGTWIELVYSLTKKHYDYQTPTAVLTVLNDRSEINVEIPQIYFDNGQISQNIKIELYSTKGAVNYSLSGADLNSIQANFDTSSSVFSAPLAQMPSYTLIPTTLEVQGGSNALSYEQIRYAIVNQSLYDRVAITANEVLEKGRKAGFNLTRVIDDLTERMYYASNILVDDRNLAIPTFSGEILIANNALKGDPSSIIDHTDGYYTILPTTTFIISNNRQTCIPMSDGQVEVMSKMTKTELVAELNKGTYVRQPFHITLLTSAKSPEASIYNLLSPSMTSLKFVKENPHSAPQMSAVKCEITHLDNGTGGFMINLGMGISSNIIDVDPSVFNVFLTCKTKSGFFAYLPAEYNSTNADGLDIWTIKLGTEYHITTDNYISVFMYNSDDVLSVVDVQLTQDFNIITSFNRELDPAIQIDSDLNLLLPPSDQSVSNAMMTQTITLSLGKNLSSQIYCGVNTSWGNDVYQTAPETIYYTTSVPVFQDTEQGIINTRYNTATKALEVIKLYEQDDVPANSDDIKLVTTAEVSIPTNGNTTRIPLTSSDKGFLKGMPVRGMGIPVGTVVNSVANSYVTLSKRIVQAIPKGVILTFTNGKFLLRTTTNQSNVRTQLTVASTAGLLVGQSVFGFDLASESMIKSIDSDTQVTLNVATMRPVQTNTLLTFINTSAPGVIKVQKGEVMSDASGNPIVVKYAQNQYMIPSILFDGRLFASDDINDQQIVGTISQRLQNFANQIKTLDAGLEEVCDVFYKPARTMGYATFSIGSGQTIDMLLELSFTVSVYVDVAVYNTQPLLDTIEESIVVKINEILRKSKFISISDITEEIKDLLGSNVSAVEMGPISGVDDLRLVSLRDYDSSPCIEHRLFIDTDGSIIRKPNIDVKFLPKPDTADLVTFEAL